MQQGLRLWNYLLIIWIQVVWDNNLWKPKCKMTMEWTLDYWKTSLLVFSPRSWKTDLDLLIALQLYMISEGIWWNLILFLRLCIKWCFACLGRRMLIWSHFLSTLIELWCFGIIYWYSTVSHCLEDEIPICWLHNSFRWMHEQL